eukprot:XP_024457133.1 glycine-rich protein DOT1-like [Populus trichocarpa]
MTSLALYSDSLGRLVVGNISKAENIKRIERCHAIDSKEYEAKYGKGKGEEGGAAGKGEREKRKEKAGKGEGEGGGAAEKGEGKKGKEKAGKGKGKGVGRLRMEKGERGRARAREGKAGKGEGRGVAAATGKE